MNSQLKRNKLMFIKTKLRKHIDSTWIKYPNPGLVVAHHEFKQPYPSVGNDLLLAMAYMDLLIQGVYPAITAFTKLTLIADCIVEGSNLTTALTTAVKFTYDSYAGEEETALLLTERHNCIGPMRHESSCRY